MRDIIAERKKQSVVLGQEWSQCCQKVRGILYVE